MGSISSLVWLFAISWVINERAIGGYRKPSHGEKYTGSYFYNEQVEHVHVERGNIIIEECAGIMREDGESNVGPDI